MVPNFKYQCVLGIDAIRQFRLIVDGNANVIRMAYNNKVYRTATIDLLPNLAWIDDDGCAAIKELTKTQMALVENFLKRDLRFQKRNWMLPTFPNIPLMWVTIRPSSRSTMFVPLL